MMIQAQPRIKYSFRSTGIKRVEIKPKEIIKKIK
jgi:hypothetical protein